MSVESITIPVEPGSRRASPSWASRRAPWLALAGTIILLVGLSVDAILHRLDPTLAEREGIFTLANPGHLLFALGLALIVASGVLSLAGQLATGGSLGRRVMVALLLICLLFVALLSWGLAAKTPGSVLAGHQHGVAPGATTAMAHVHQTADPGGTVTPEQRTAADQLARAVKAGTARFTDFSVARTDGYRQVTAYFLPGPNGNFGPAHFLNVSDAMSGNYLDPSHPAELVYFRVPDGTMLLLGAMFLAPIGQGPRPGGPLTAWHTHDNLCYDGRIFSVANAAGQCPAGSQQVDDRYEMMHVWTFDNPDGPFAHDLTRADYLAAIRQLDPKGALP